MKWLALILLVRCILLAPVKVRKIEDGRLSWGVNWLIFWRARETTFSSSWNDEI